MGGFLKKVLPGLKTAVSAPEEAPAQAAAAPTRAVAMPTAPAMDGEKSMMKRRRRGGRMSTVLTAVDEKLGG
jgi:hypothetical protein